MKLTSTFWKLFLLSLFFAPAAFGQSDGDYRSIATGNWSNSATWERYDGGTLTWVGSPAPPTFSDGQISIRNGNNVTIDASVTADQLTVETGGTLSINIFVSTSGGNDLTLNDGPGTDLVVDGTLVLGTYNLLIGSGSALINGTMTWTSGTLGVATTTGSSSVISLANNDVVKRINSSFTNNGTLNWATGTSSGGIYFNDGTFINNGTINEQFQSDRGFFGESGTNSFTNNGTFNKTTSFVFGNFNVPFTNTGSLKGQGTFNLSGTVANSGTINPGASPGVLTASPATITGQTPVLNMEIVNGTAGTGYDQLNVTGTTDLTGTALFVYELDQSAPLQTYTIMTATSGNFTGNFAYVLIPQGYTLDYTNSGETSITVTKNSATLPVLWGNFAAIANAKSVKLSWSTLQEVNTSSFDIEYSSDGRIFHTIASVPAKGNSDQISNYSYIHTTPDITRGNFYRIKQIDIDGKFTYSTVRTVKFNKGDVVPVLAMPNPFKDVLQLSIQEQGIRITLSDLSGKLLFNRLMQPGVQQIDMQNRVSGLYILTVYQGNEIIDVQKVIKQ
ncbi:MAG: T9SS type A sorting domain-containing protein [Terrimonas sp.]|nr:T9SS type A sorting domain-containing protein [Terrimonas sp.]